MAKMTIAMTGDKALDRKLKKLGKDSKKAVRKASRPALKPVLQESRELAPVRTGALKKSIKIRALKRSRVWTGSRVTTALGKGQNQFYGGFQEYGTKRGVKARRFMGQAAERKRQQAMGIYKRELGKQIVELAKKG
jgi:HK97 gp10 family phage protein